MTAEGPFADRRRRPWARPGAAVLAATAVIVALTTPGRPATASPARAVTGPGTGTGTLVLGSQVLRACGPAYCGRLPVPLDWAEPSAGRITIAFRWFPAQSGSGSLGTVLPVEGGPGYPSIGSVAYGASGGYASMYGPLLDRRNLLAVDLRGTGHSNVIDCPTLQNWSGPTGIPSFDQAAGRCAAALDTSYSGAVRASSLFTSAAAAMDVAAVVRALDAGPVDLYGDSYGSWFAQVFASRYPSLVRSVVLDSTYQVRGLDPWYRSTIDSLRADFRTVCLEAPACAAQTPDGWAPIERLAARLRAAPVSGVVPGPQGTPVAETMGVVGLVDLVNDAAEDPVMYRELDGAATALVDHGDPAALLRLYAQRFLYDENYFDTPATDYSAGLYLAVSCLDYPQLFDMAATPAERAAQLAGRVSALPPATFAPFSTGEWIDMDQNTETYTGCLDWPQPEGAIAPVGGNRPLLPPTMPVLVLGGQLDAWTPPSGVPAVQKELGGHSRFVEMANSTHVVAEGDLYGCATGILRAFVTDPSRLDSLDVSCGSSIPPIHAVGDYPETPAQVAPVVVTSPAAAAPGLTGRRLATAAVDTAGDAVIRSEAVGAPRDTGLHGGQIISAAGGSRLTLISDQLVPGVSVSGTVTVHGNTATAELTVSSPAGGRATVSESVEATWQVLGTGLQASVTVALDGGAPYSGTTAAP